MTEVVLLYILYLRAVYVGAADLLSLRVWVKELVALDRVADYNLLCFASLVFAPKRARLRSYCNVGAAAAGASCFVLLN
ncbi:hypothetical protein TETLON2a_000109 [Candidatus Hodgkinia cicadicola]|nr:hypothetical protein TETLON2a_000109 [Candidatus Hodgkinia cicadicola]